MKERRIVESDQDCRQQGGGADAGQNKCQGDAQLRNLVEMILASPADSSDADVPGVTISDSLDPTAYFHGNFTTRGGAGGSFPPPSSPSSSSPSFSSPSLS